MKNYFKLMWNAMQFKKGYFGKNRIAAGIAAWADVVIFLSLLSAIVYFLILQNV